MPDIKIKDADGVYRTYQNVNEIELDTTTEGETAVFKNAPDLEEKTITVTENGTSEITPSAGKDGISKVELTVDVPSSTVRGVTKRVLVKTGNNIAAGDFVRTFGQASVSSYLNLGSGTSSTGLNARAIKLTDSKIFLTQYSSSSGLWARVVDVNADGVMTSGTLTRIGNQGQLAENVKISDTKVFCVHGRVTDNVAYMYGMLIDISGNEITVVYDVLLDNTAHSGQIVSVALIDSTHVLVFHKRAHASVSYKFPVSAKVVEIGQASATAYTSTAIESDQVTSRINPVFKLSDGRYVFMGTEGAQQYTEADFYLIGVENTTVTKISVTSKTSQSAYDSYYSKTLIKTPSGRLAYLFLNSVGKKVMYQYITVSENTITKETTKELVATDVVNASIAAVTVGNKVAVFFKPDTTNTSCSVIFAEENNGELIVSGDIQTLTGSVSYRYLNYAVQFSESVAVVDLISGSYAGYMQSIKAEANTVVGFDVSKPIFGVAETAGAGGDTINVTVPNY